MGRNRLVADPSDIVNAAYNLIDREGYESFSARRLAQDLGISHMTLYNYLAFDQILDGVIIQGIEEITSAIQPQVPDKAEDSWNPCALYKIIAGELVGYAKRRPNLYRFIFQGGIGPATQNPQVRKLYWRGMVTVRRLLDPVRHKELRRDGFLFLVLVNGLILSFLASSLGMDEEASHWEIDRNIDRGYELMLGGLYGMNSTDGTDTQTDSEVQIS